MGSSEGRPVTIVCASSGSRFSARDDDEEIGFLNRKVLNSFTAEITGLEILLPFRRRGAGRALVEKALDVCTAEGRTCLSVRGVNDDALEFFLKLGFVPLEEIPGAYLVRPVTPDLCDSLEFPDHWV